MHCPKTISMNWEDMEPISKYPVHVYKVKLMQNILFYTFRNCLLYELAYIFFWTFNCLCYVNETLTS